MRKLVLPFLIATTAISSAAHADMRSQVEVDAQAFAQLPVEDDALATMRGGFGLPGGLEVSVAVQSDTRVNGLLLLRSVFVVDKGAPELSVFGRTGDVASSTARTGNGVPSSTVTISGGTFALGGASEGLERLDVSAGGASVATAGGSVRVDKAGAGSQVVLSGPTLDVSHLAGQAYGSVIANRGNDVTIDTVTNINIDLKNTMPSNIGSAMFRVEALAIDSAARLGR